MVRLRRKRVAEPAQSVWDVPARFNFTRDVVEALAADSRRPAMTFVDREGVIDRLTFREVAAEANRWAALLRARGLLPGDRLLVVVGKTPAWHAILLGALKAGLVAVPCSEMLRAGDLAFRVEHSGARLVVADRAAAPELARMNAAADVVFVEDVTPELRSASPVQPTHDTAIGDIAFILYTSGTTKDPKGVTHTHGYTWSMRLQASHWLDARPGDLVWCTAGTGWAKSIWNVFLGPWSCGAEIVLHEGGFDVEERYDLLQRLGVTVLCQAPTEYRLMAKLEGMAQLDLGRLRHAVSAGEPLNREVINAFRDAFGLTIYDGYGQTENTLLVANHRGAEIRPGSMGVPTPGHDVAVIDEDGNELQPGEEGDIALRGRPPSLFVGYWNAPDETRAAFRGPWYLTGDRATRDADGYLWFAGRADDIILSAASRIGPFEVESALLEHPAVAESAVIGKAHSDRGEIVKAFVVVRPGYEASVGLVAELQDHVKGVTAPYKYPREIEFVGELPKTRSGKIRRVELRTLERQRTAGAADGPAPLPEPVEVQAAGSHPAMAPVREPDQPAPEAEAFDVAAGAAAEPAANPSRRARWSERRQHKDDERRRREQERLTAERARLDAKERQRAEQKAADERRREEARRRAQDEERRRDEERHRKDEERHRKDEEKRLRDERRKRPTAASAPPAGDEEKENDRPNPTLVSRLRDYGRRDDPPTPPDESL
jgi:acyl-coenzyme A synthetase/AMP-(fatty) acid ligase